MVCMDNKAIIPVGEPGAPVSTGVRGQHQSTSASIGALDHDFHIHGVVASVSLVIDTLLSTGSGKLGPKMILLY